MGDPEIRNDEKVLLRTPGVYVKSIPFEGILTNKRVILVDRAKNLLPPKEIPLATIKQVETGENAIRDQVLTLSVMAKTGDTRQMILTFSRQEGGNRIKERDEWARLIQANLGASFENIIRKVIPGADAAPRRAEPVAQPRVSVVTPAPQPAPAERVAPAAPAPVPVVTPAPVHREAEGIHPIKKIIDAGPAPVAAAPASAPAAVQSVFCSRCGNKVPVDSAFCNRCGSPIVVPGTTPAPAPAPAPAAKSAAAPAPAPITVAPVMRPLDRDIQTIEPLIERSTEKVPSDPLRKPIPDVPVHQSLSWDDDATPSPAPVPVGTPAPAGSATTNPAEPPTKRGFLPKLFSPKTRTQWSPAPAAPAPAAAPPVPEKPRRNLPIKQILIGVAAIAVILIVVAVGFFVVLPMLNSSGGSSTAPGSTAASSATSSSSGQQASAAITLRATQAPTIPVTGVYVHVNYLGGFRGSYGIPPDSLTTVPGNSGDRVWEVEKANGTVTAEFEKLDGTAHELLVEIYKNGAVLTKGSTSVGHGSVKLSVDTATGIAATPITSGGSAAAPAAATTTASGTAAATNKTTTAAATTAVTTATTTAVATTTATTTTTAATTTTASP